ncbi:ATP-binding protein [Streptomyces zingiberis]|uniref:ATP-binding protein n=1 Tax=Streptomyces zingiberis TaxID=2053010 RepID=A0ABX1BZ62_9ACTN|nr:ATP-binding protein [Streptomyces zingiberis]NJQ01608.1 ATP-binding protein [Streptomyces zingiberis]
MYRSQPGAPSGGCSSPPAHALPGPLAAVFAEPAGRAGPWPLPRSGEACALARRAVRHTLSSWALGDLADTAELLVSEVVANALRHTRGPVQLTVVHGGSRWWCGVGDAGPGFPRIRPATPDDECGRGMAMIAQLACAWGADHTAWGKEVWFSLPVGVRSSGVRD